jgi:hypothetical protein
MRLGLAVLGLCVCITQGAEGGQTRRAATPRPVATPPTREAAQLTCPTPLGVGVNAKVSYCDVLVGRDPNAGILVAIPPHRGTVTLSFDLHNRHTYSEEQAKNPRAAFARYTASIGALTMDNTLISRAAIQSEFRSPTDFIDRIGGGAGTTGLKAVAPTGIESITLTIPESENQVSILGEKLLVERAEGTATYTSLGRPIAIISNVMVEYRPPAPVRAPAARPRTPTRPRTPGQ